MSKILIISDTHYLRKRDLAHFFEQIDDLRAIIHCGDIYPMYKDRDFKNFYLCRGNNDFNDQPIVNRFFIDDLSFIVTHGHRDYYAYNPHQLIELADNQPVDFICFGHTHIPYYGVYDKTVIINPGSLALSRTFPRVNTYALLDTKTKNITFHDVATHNRVNVEKEVL